MPAPRIQVQGFTACFDGKPAVKNLDLEIFPHDVSRSSGRPAAARRPSCAPSTA